MTAPPGGDVPASQLGGLLGDALRANLHGRLSHFITDAQSPAIALFDPAHACCNQEGDWYGEHAGKWLVAASRAAARSGDAALAGNVRCVADYLVSLQQPDGYLGTYAPSHRFDAQPVPPVTDAWDGAPSRRTWDVWTHAYLVLGLLEAHRHLHAPAWLDAARRIGDLCWRVFVEQGVDITALGNHFGMSATVLLDPAVELYFATGEARYLDLALRIVESAEANPRLRLLSRALEGADASEIGTGKAYQLLWNLVGLAKLHRATGAPVYLDAVQRMWRNIAGYHVGIGGGPFGGIGHRSREVFNPAGVFEPTAYIETCSTLAWIQLNRELLRITGEPRYAEEIERSACNDLLGAQAADGEGWCYYTFANGPRIHTTYWRCCKSSGAMALEELPWLACTMDAQGAVSVHLPVASRTVFAHPAAGRVEVEVRTKYPLQGDIAIEVTAERRADFPLRVRIPRWALGATLRVDGEGGAIAQDAGRYADIVRPWSGRTRLQLDLPMAPVLHRRVHANVQVSRAPDGSEVRQPVLHRGFVALTRGPLVYATGLVDGYKAEESVALPQAPDDAWIEALPADAAGVSPIRLRPLHRPALLFEPFALAGGRADGAWRVAWLAQAPGQGADHGSQ